MKAQFENKYVALNWRLKRRRELMAKVERYLRQINQIDREIEMIHGSDKDTSEEVQEKLYEPRLGAEA